MKLQERPGATDPAVSDATLNVIRDMILQALDLTEAENLTEQNRKAARAALAEALDAIEGGAA